MSNNFGTEDPYFETVPATRLDGRPSKKTKKRKKALPLGISEHDAKILTKVKRRAYRLDMSLFNCCGIRFGWSSVIGIIPFAGDAIDAFMAMMVYRTCQQVDGGLPSDVQAKMMFNICLDFGIGLIPFLGDIADAVFRANTRNAVVLEKFLRAKGAKALKNQGIATPPNDPTDPDEYDRQLREELGPPLNTALPLLPGKARKLSMESSQHNTVTLSNRDPYHPHDQKLYPSRKVADGSAVLVVRRSSRMWKGEANWVTVRAICGKIDVEMFTWTVFVF